MALGSNKSGTHSHRSHPVLNTDRVHSVHATVDRKWHQHVVLHHSAVSPSSCALTSNNSGHPADSGRATVDPKWPWGHIQDYKTTRPTVQYYLRVMPFGPRSNPTKVVNKMPFGQRAITSHKSGHSFFTVNVNRWFLRELLF